MLATTVLNKLLCLVLLSIVIAAVDVVLYSISKKKKKLIINWTKFSKIIFKTRETRIWCMNINANWMVLYFGDCMVSTFFFNYVFHIWRCFILFFFSPVIVIVISCLLNSIQMNINCMKKKNIHKSNRNVWWASILFYKNLNSTSKCFIIITTYLDHHKQFKSGIADNEKVFFFICFVFKTNKQKTACSLIDLEWLYDEWIKYCWAWFDLIFLFSSITESIEPKNIAEAHRKGIRNWYSQYTISNNNFVIK